jgi:sarcosine oxidase, subunit beta
MTDIIIIGAGILGCSVALELARRGERATVIDRLGEAGHGTTAASCGIVRRYYSTVTMTAMAHEGAAIWSAWRSYLKAEEEEQLAHFVRCGMLFIPPAIDQEAEASLERMRELGVDVELLSREEIARRFPFLDTRSHTPVRSPAADDFLDDTGRFLDGAIFERDAGYVVSPLLATANLRAAAEREGATFLLGTGVTAIEKGGGNERFRLLLDDRSTLDADVVINVAGPHSTMINRMAGVSLPIEIRPLRKEVSAVSNPEFTPKRGTDVPIVGDVDSGIYFRPEAGGRDLIVGSLDPTCDSQEWVEDPDRNDENISPAAHERHVMRLMKRFPEVLLEKRRGLASLYDVTLSDWNPVIDRTDEPGFYVAIGTSGSSFKTAPVIGKVMAALIEACEGGWDHDGDPLQVKLDQTGFELDVGFFSRLRGAHHSSRTVLG